MRVICGGDTGDLTIPTLTLVLRLMEGTRTAVKVFDWRLWREMEGLRLEVGVGVVMSSGFWSLPHILVAFLTRLASNTRLASDTKSCTELSMFLNAREIL